MGHRHPAVPSTGPPALKDPCPASNHPIGPETTHQPTLGTCDGQQNRTSLPSVPVRTGLHLMGSAANSTSTNFNPALGTEEAMDTTPPP